MVAQRNMLNRGSVTLSRKSVNAVAQKVAKLIKPAVPKKSVKVRARGYELMNRQRSSSRKTKRRTTAQRRKPVPTPRRRRGSNVNV